MERLTAFEFIAADDRNPTLVRLKYDLGMNRGFVVINEFMFVGWVGIRFTEASEEIYEFESFKDLIIEGQGVGRPYWNSEPTPWSKGFDPASELRRVAIIRAAVQRELNAASLVVM